MVSHAILFCHVHYNQTKPAGTEFYLFKLATATKVDATVKCQMCVMKISIIVTDVVY